MQLPQLTKTFIKLVLGRGVGSQCGEDTILLSVLPTRGTYLDVGAYHPHLYSNTYALYRKGWRGVAIDPNPSMSSLWRIFRPRDRFVNCAIGPRSFATYYQYKDGAYNGFEKLPDRAVVAESEIEVLPLSYVLRTPIDFLNIDCEGMDYAILQTHDWSVMPKVIAVEGEEGGSAHTLLLSKGYLLHTTRGATLIYTLHP